MSLSLIKVKTNNLSRLFLWTIFIGFNSDIGLTLIFYLNMIHYLSGRTNAENKVNKADEHRFTSSAHL